MYQPHMLPRISYWALAAALAIYAGLIVIDVATLSADLRFLVIALPAVVAGFLVTRRARPFSMVEKAVL